MEGKNVDCNFLPIYRGDPSDVDGGTFWKGINHFVATLTQWISIPLLIDGPGKGSWDGQLRRTSILFRADPEFVYEQDPGKIEDALRRSSTGALSIFMEELRKKENLNIPKSANGKVCGEGTEFEFTLIGHSMGTIILNRFITENQDLCFTNIVFMAAADSIKNTHDAVFPYLEKSKTTNFYNLTLHPNDETDELFIIPVVPRGSLLVWIDNYYANPLTPQDRTMGQWDNIMRTTHMIPNEIKSRVTFKAFSEGACVKEHGDFSKAEFWKEEFWQVKQGENVNENCALVDP